jgi:hypothetical protein
MPLANMTALAGHLGGMGMPKDAVLRAFRSFNAGAIAFAEESKKHE